ncbi:MAG: GyrI-like domain-containing protein [Hyphomicrobiaceae bacterium]|nr:GyrI-like domain-containing protein [Hyphomicrobiaceae bacterium]
MSQYAISTVELLRRPTLVTRFTCRPDELGRRFLADLPRICDVVEAGNCAIAGPPFARYVGSEGDHLDVEVGVILVEPHAGEGDVIASALPGGPTAKTLHIGHYEALGAAHDALRIWAHVNGRPTRGTIYELYVCDPSDGDDPSGWRTEVYLPLE